MWLLFSAFSVLAQEPVVRELPDVLDQVVIQLEQDSLLDAAGLEPQARGFAEHFFTAVVPILKVQKLTARDLEERLRRWNTGMHLLAVPREMAERMFKGWAVCITPFGDTPTPNPTYWLFLSRGGPEQASRYRSQFGIPNESVNRARLHDAGLLFLCQES